MNPIFQCDRMIRSAFINVYFRDGRHELGNTFSDKKLADRRKMDDCIYRINVKMKPDQRRLCA